MFLLFRIDKENIQEELSDLNLDSILISKDDLRIRLLNILGEMNHEKERNYRDSYPGLKYVDLKAKKAYFISNEIVKQVIDNDDYDNILNYFHNSSVSGIELTDKQVKEMKQLTEFIPEETDEDYELNEIFYALWYDEDIEEILVCINTPKSWEEEQCLTDWYSDITYEALEPELEKLNLSEVSSSTYIFNEEITMEDAKDKLEKSNLSFRQDFQDWINNYVK